jgi:hypothetical protein
MCSFRHTQGAYKCATNWQVLLSSDDLKMMMEEVTAQHADDGPPTVDLRKFLRIMEYSAW